MAGNSNSNMESPVEGGSISNDDMDRDEMEADDIEDESPTEVRNSRVTDINYETVMLCAFTKTLFVPYI